MRDAPRGGLRQLSLAPGSPPARGHTGSQGWARGGKDGTSCWPSAEAKAWPCPGPQRGSPQARRHPTVRAGAVRGGSRWKNLVHGRIRRPGAVWAPRPLSLAALRLAPPLRQGRAPLCCRARRAPSLPREGAAHSVPTAVRGACVLLSCRGHLRSRFRFASFRNPTRSRGSRAWLPPPSHRRLVL